MTKPQYTEIERYSSSSQSRGGGRITNFLLHTQEGNGDAESLAGYLQNPANQVSYHYTGRNGVVCDVVDTDLASWSVGDANGYTINYCFAGSFASWSHTQWLNIRDDIRIAAWIAVQDATKYKFSTEVLAPPYGKRRDGISDHRYITDVIGWGTHTDVGPGFPWDVFAAAVAEFAGSQPNGAAAMALLDETFINWQGKQTSVGTALKFIDQYNGLILDQLVGPRSREQGGDPTRWVELGNRTIVETLGVILTHLGIEPEATA